MDRDKFKKLHDPDPKSVAIDDYIAKLEAENERLKKEVGTDERLFEYIKNSISTMHAPKKVDYPKPKLKHDDLHASLVITDAHSEESVVKEEMEGLAVYNWKTFEYRMQKTAEKTLEIVNIMRQASNINCLDIWSLGDWFVGKILPHEEAHGVEMPLPVAVPGVCREFSKMLVGLSAHFEKIRVWGLCGNHGRDSRKKVFKMTADRNWDMTVYLVSQLVTENCKNIEWHIPHSIMKVADVMGWKCLLTHSGEVNMNNRVPYYPIETTFDMEHKVRSGTSEDFHYVFTGHWHHHAMLDSSIILCPCMIGPNQFSRFKLHRQAKAEQLLCFFTKKHGIVTQWPIKLGNIT